LAIQLKFTAILPLYENVYFNGAERLQVHTISSKRETTDHGIVEACSPHSTMKINSKFRL